MMQDLAFKTHIALLVMGIMPNALRVLAGKAAKNVKAPIFILQIANGLFIFGGDYFSPQVTFACGTVTAASAFLIGVNQIRQLVCGKKAFHLLLICHLMRVHLSWISLLGHLAVKQLL